MGFYGFGLGLWAVGFKGLVEHAARVRPVYGWLSALATFLTADAPEHTAVRFRSVLLDLKSTGHRHAIGFRVYGLGFHWFRVVSFRVVAFKV